jgi:hypothetical protein
MVLKGAWYDCAPTAAQFHPTIPGIDGTHRRVSQDAVPDDHLRAQWG